VAKAAANRRSVKLFADISGPGFGRGFFLDLSGETPPVTLGLDPRIPTVPQRADRLARIAAGVLIFLLAGLLTIDTLWLALLPAGLYVGFHVIEGETVTPMLLARRFTLNPVLVIISLVFWFWMWGIPGVILSVPTLAIAKIICDRVRPLAAIGHFLEG
jgi:hypothetical protein